MQLRVSEALCVLPFYMPEATAGLFIGCLMGNLLAGCIPIDIAFGSLATLVAALVTAYIAKKGGSKWLLPLPSVVINALVVGAVLCYGYGVGVPYYLCATYVFIGQRLIQRSISMLSGVAAPLFMRILNEFLNRDNISGCTLCRLFSIQNADVEYRSCRYCPRYL